MAKLARPEYDKTAYEFCTKCGEVKPHAAFPKGSKKGTKKRSGLHYWCLACNNVATVLYRTDPVKRRRWQDACAQLARRKLVEAGKVPADYWDDKPILEHKPLEYVERLRLLGFGAVQILEAFEIALHKHPLRGKSMEKANLLRSELREAVGLADEAAVA